MKKLLLIIAGIVFATSFLNAQSLTIKTLEGEVIGESYIIYDEGDVVNEIVFHAVVTNNTGSDMTVLCAREQIDMLPGTSSQFCWGENCYPPFVDTSATALVIPGGGTTADDAFSGHYAPATVHGTSAVKYKFYNQDDPSEFVETIAYYVYGFVDVEENLAKLSFSDFYPNPASDQIRMDYSIGNNVLATLRVVNLLGAVVKEVNLSGTNTLNMDVSDLQQGVYYCSVISGAQVHTTKRIVVQK